MQAALPQEQRRPGIWGGSIVEGFVELLQVFQDGLGQWSRFRAQLFVHLHEPALFQAGLLTGPPSHGSAGLQWQVCRVLRCLQGPECQVGLHNDTWGFLRNNEEAPWR